MITSDVSHEKRSRIRFRQILLATSWNSVARCASFLVNVAQVPLALRFLQSDGFGVWITLTSMVQMLNFADLGTGLSLQNEVSRAYARDDYAGIADLYATAKKVLLLIGGVVLLTGLPFCFAINWGTIFHVSNPWIATEIPMALAMLLAVFCAGFPLNAAARVATGLQLGWIQSMWLTIGSGLSLLFIWVVGHFGGRFSLFVLAAVTPQTLSGVGVLFTLKRYLTGNRSLGLGSFKKPVVRPLLVNGFAFIIPQFAGIVLNSAPAVMVTNALGPVAVAPFAVAQKMVFAILQIQQMPILPLWPAFSEAHGRGDTGWVIRTFKHAMLYALVSAAVAAIVMLTLGPKLVLLWTGKVSVVPSIGLLECFALWFAAIALMAPIIVLLNACGWIRGQAVGSALSAAVLVIITPSLTRQFGLIGGVIGPLVASGMAVWPISLYDAIRLFRSFRQ